MKSAFMKGITAFTLCASLVLSNLQFAGASVEQSAANVTSAVSTDVTNDNTDTTTPANSKSEHTEEADTAAQTPAATDQTSADEVLITVTPATDITVTPTPVDIPEVQVPLEEAIPKPDSQPAELITVSDNALATVSDNCLTNSQIENLKKTEDGREYILEKQIEGTSVTVNMFIPVDLFKEAKELSFDAVPVTTEQEQVIDQIFEAETEEKEEITVAEFAAYDISLFVDEQPVIDFEGSVRIVFHDTDLLVTQKPEVEVEVYYFDEEKKEIEVLETQAEGEGTAEASIEHFSIYGYRILDKKELLVTTRSDVLRSLGLARYFGVFAREFHLESHMEGSIAVQNLVSATSSAQMTDSTYTNAASDFKATLKKQLVTAENQDMTFYFALYSIPNPTKDSVREREISVTVPAGSTEGETVIHELSGSKLYYLFELDENGDIISSGSLGKISGKSYIASYSANDIDADSNIISSIGAISYIEKVTADSTCDLITGGSINQIPEVIFGSQCEVYYKNNSSNMPYVRMKDSGRDGCQLNSRTICHIAEKDEKYPSFPIEFDKEFNNLDQLSINLAFAKSDNDIKVIRKTVNEDGKLDLKNEAVITDGSLLIYNIDCGELNEVSVSNFPSVDGSGDSGWSRTYSNVVYNFYKTVNHNVQRYEGKITIENAVHGTIFAPAAAYSCDHTTVGSVIANSVTIGGEIHQTLLTDDSSTRNVKICCTNEKIHYDVSISKEAELKSWDDRIYTIHLGADSAGIITKNAADFILVYDYSASMTWLLPENVPTQTKAPGLYTTIAELNRTDGEALDSNAKSQPMREGNYADSTNWNFKYYALNDWGEYQPIAYVDSNWNYIGVTSEGVKSRDDDRNPYNQSSQVPDHAAIYIRQEGDKIKIDALKEYTKKFVNDVKKTSPDSGIAIVAFSKGVSNASDNALIKASEIEVEDYISRFDTSITGGTNQQQGLIRAKEILNRGSFSSGETIPNIDSRRRNVVLFSDGNPNASKEGVNADTIQQYAANQIFPSATMYSVGICNTDSVKYSGFKDNVTRWATRPENAFVNNTTDEIIKALSKIYADTIGEVRGTVIDYIDNRFELLNSEEIESTGGVISYDQGGRTLITWKDVCISGSWSKDFDVKARDSYAGGNDVYTNGPESGVIVDTDNDGNDDTIQFPRPTVNVKVRFEVPDAGDVFFLGEKIGDVYSADVFAEKFIESSENGIPVLKYTEIMDGHEKTYEYTDLRDVTVTGKVKEGLLENHPAKTETYQDAVSIIVTPFSTGAGSAGNMRYFGETPVNGCDSKGNRLVQDENGWYYAVETPVTDSGDYTAYVVDGTFEIAKKIDRKYETENISRMIKDNQSFIFRIERYDRTGDQYIRDDAFGNVYETISFGTDDSQLKKTKSVIGLKAGYYKVTEETDWSWKYEQSPVEIKGVNEDGYVHIGERKNVNGKVNFKGLDMLQRKYPDAGRYYELPDEAKKMINTEMDHKDVDFLFTNLFTTDTGKRKWLGDVSLMENIFE